MSEPFPFYLTYDDVLLAPNYSEITPPETSLKTHLGLLALDIPFISAPMDTVTEGKMAQAMALQGGLGVIHRNLTISQQVEEVTKALAFGPVGAALGVGADLIERTKALIACGTTVLCLDSAHGHTKNVIEAVKMVKTQAPHILLMAGNTATYEGTCALFEAGADVVKIGMGPGSICTTRIVSGMGVPQLSAVFEAARAAKEYGRPIIADGGIRSSGDIVKALAAGASAVMVGSLLAATEETPGESFLVEGAPYKTYRGMGSQGAMTQGSAARYGQSLTQKRFTPEGIEGKIPCKGPVEEVLCPLLGGIRAGMAYLGAQNLEELQTKARFLRISPASMAESHPHLAHLPL